ncbi:MAG: YkgJ family cysteine cluster protein [Pyrodictiaceae archaeon]
MTSKYIPITPHTRFRFKCLRCDKCCGTGPNVALTVFDIVRIARFLKIHWNEFLKNYTRVIIADMLPFVSLKGDEKGRCPFLSYKPNGETLCVIYPARPMRCRLYPIIVESVSPLRLYLDPKCPGIGEGSEVVIPLNDLKKYIKERREHYRLLYELIFVEGLEPLEALERAIERVWRTMDDDAASERS